MVKRNTKKMGGLLGSLFFFALTAVCIMHVPHIIGVFLVLTIH